MEQYVATWCPVCDKRVSDRGRDTYGLLNHIREFHPKRSNQYLIQEKESRAASKQLTSKGSVRTGNSRKSEPRKVYATRGTVLHDNNSLYRVEKCYVIYCFATVDTWKSHSEKKLCPRCKKEAVPTLHARGDKLTTSHIGALCLLGCWPLCFVPLMMKRAKKVRMICPLCGYSYGSYQYKNTGLAPCNTASEDSQAQLSSPPKSFRPKHSRG
nr:PREDICTED: lipopolysaccharide-induced tumor necrosis factor-alpha factor isoform X1 [Megachile rotundata]